MSSYTEKARIWFRNYIGVVLIVIASISYIFLGYIRIDETGKTIEQIIADGVLALIFGLTINMLMTYQGVTTGERVEKVMATNELHAKEVISISNDANYLEKFCEITNAQELKKQRTMILISAGIKYHDIFEDDGSIKDYRILPTDELRKIKMKAIRKAVKFKITMLTPQSLTTDVGKHKDTYDFGNSKGEYLQSKFRSSLTSKILSAVIFGYFGVSLVQDVSIANFIWTIIQVMVFLLLGGVSYFQAYIYVTDEQRGYTIRKIDTLTTFKSWLVGYKREEKNIVKISEPLGVQDIEKVFDSVKGAYVDG